MSTNNLTGFQPGNIDLSNMVDTDVKKVIIIGDGMSGKTQILITFGKMILAYLKKIYASTSRFQGSYSSGDSLGQALETFGDSYEIDSSFRTWAEQHGFFIRYGATKWDVMSVSLDTETIGFEDFHFVFPIYRNLDRKTYRVNLFGSDVGGQNIFDHFRSVLGKIAGVDDTIIVVFDKSRALSCWNSIEHVQKVVGEKVSAKTDDPSNIPKIVYIANKIDLEVHIGRNEWRDAISKNLMNNFNHILNYGKGEYRLPSLVGKKGIERSFRFKLDNGFLSFPDFEALVYNAIRQTDQDYGSQKILTDVNAKAIAREISAQLVFQRVIEKKEAKIGKMDSKTIIHILEEFGKLLFQRRPLAMQYSGGIEQIHHDTKDKDSFARVRAKWIDYNVNFHIINDKIIQSAILAATNAQNLLSEDVGSFFNTNALLGSGIMDMWDSIIQERLTKFIEAKIVPGTGGKQRKRRIIKF
ncbi:MAG: hypothetical protein ACXAC8_03045 [Candidatus Hodarchaeales archaeon]|jgi:GTPase SAR1 family protein